MKMKRIICALIAALLLATLAAPALAEETAAQAEPETVAALPEPETVAQAEPEEERPEIYIWCGTEDFLHRQNIKMRNHLRKLGYNVIYEESHGDHQWLYWDRKIQTILDWLTDEKEEA